MSAQPEELPVDPGEEQDPPITEEDASETEEETGAEQEEHPAPSGPSSETILAKRNKALDAETKRHETALRKAYGDDFETLSPCPLCLTDGWVIPAPPGAFPPEQWEAVQLAAGMMEGNSYNQAPWTEICPTCDGEGDLLTGAKIERGRLTPCRDCNAMGWREKQVPLAPVATWPITTTGSGDVVFTPIPGLAPDDWKRPAGHPRFGQDPATNGGVW